MSRKVVQVRMDGSHGCGTDLRMAMPASTGAFFRASSKQDGTMLLMGGLRAQHSTKIWKWGCCAAPDGLLKRCQRSWLTNFL